MASDDGQQHPLKVYFWIWILLFVISGFSYAVDYFQVQGYLRWTLILVFMFLKAGLIVAVFMHMMWERMALACAIILPTGAIALFIWIMDLESDYTYDTREEFFSEETFVPSHPGDHGAVTSHENAVDEAHPD